MCLIALGWNAHPRYPLVLIANRDEAHDRPATAAAPDPQHPHVHGGRDLRQGGSWLLASAMGRLAAVTNVRAGPSENGSPRSRGALVRDFAIGAATAEAFADDLAASAADYGRFNWLGWDGADLRFATNHPAFAATAVTPGVHAMSNGPFDAAWPKSTHASSALTQWLASPEAEVAPGAIDIARLEPLFDALADTTVAPDALLPDTGVGEVLERALSPPFIAGATYGTRCSSVVLVAADCIVFAERRFGPNARPLGTQIRHVRRLG